jgi:hypothetical protein
MGRRLGWRLPSSPLRPGFGIAYVGGDYADDGCYVTRRVRTPFGYRLRTVNVCY